MNKESLTVKLLDLAEGRETPESWRNWWDEHETELEALLSRGEFLKLKPCRHGFQWVPVLTSQKGAIAILEKSGTAFEASNLYQERYLAEDAFCKEQELPRGKSKRNSRPTTRSVYPIKFSKAERCWTPLTRSSPPDGGAIGRMKRAGLHAPVPGAGVFPADNYYIYFENVWTKFHHLRSTTLKDHDSAKEAINQAHAYALEQGTFDQKVFYEAFGIFDNQSIEKSLVSENPLVRIFALLDRRLGKRRLLALEDSMEQELDWVRAFYVIRLQAEGLMEANNI